MIALTCIMAEIYKELIETRRYLFSLLTSIGVQAMIFVGMLYVAISFSPIQAEPGDRTTHSFLLVGYLVWMFAALALSNMGQDITNETTAGTFEQKCMAAASLPIVLIGRAIGNTIISFAYVFVLLLVLSNLISTPIDISISVIPIIILTLIGVYGLGFIIAGAAILFKRIGQIAYAIQLLLLFFGGLSNPETIQMLGFVNYLPLTMGVQACRELLLYQSSLSDIATSGLISSIALNSAVYMIIGLIVFNLCSARARIVGSLGKY